MVRYRSWRDPYQWHPWWAWFPVQVDSGNCVDPRYRYRVTVWGEKVERRYAGLYWSYRPFIPSSQPVSPLPYMPQGAGLSASSRPPLEQ